MDLSNEELNFGLDKEAAKISEVKVGGRQIYQPTCLVRTDAPGAGCVGRHLFQPLTLTSDIFAAP